MRHAAHQLIAAAVVASTIWAPSAEAARVCPGDKAAFEKHLGEYASTRLLANITKERSVPRAVQIENDAKPEQPYVVLVTSEQLYTSRSWHEPDVVITDCLDIAGDTLRIDGRPQAYIRVTEDHVAYFNALLFGCFKDETGAPWCFKPNTIDVGTRRFEARLLMDRAELPDENIVGVPESETGLWVFRPTPNNGWHVFQLIWSVEDEPPSMDWTKPWRTLSPQAKP